MIANIYISGQIGTFDGTKGVELTDVIQQVQKNKDAESYNVYIDSVGGYVDIGFDIYNYLKSLNKPITTIGSGVVASISTIIFLAGSVRKLRPNTQFMIHLPQGGVQGTSLEIESYNSELKQIEKQIISLYKEITGLEEQAIKPMLINETFLSSEQAFDLGFTTEKEAEKMVAKLKINKNNNMSNFSEENKSWLENTFKGIFNKYFKPKNIMLLDANGVEIDFPNIEEGVNPKVGDSATIDGSPAQGEYVMPSLGNAKVTFEAGVITEIIEENSDELENLKNENADLKAQIESLTNNLQAEKTNFINLKKDFRNFKNEISARFTPEKNFKDENDNVEISDRMKNLKNKIKK